MKKAIAAMIFACALQGCSSSAPSDTEIEAAVHDQLANLQLAQCKGIAIENVAKKNGVKVNDSTYQILVGYDVRIIPVANGNSQIEALIAEQETAEAAYLNAGKEIMRITEEENSGYSIMPGELIAYPQKMTERTRPLVDQYVEADKRATELRNEIGERNRATNETWGPELCRVIAGEGPAGVFRFPELSKAIRIGATQSFELEMTLMKTDNGWLLTR